MCKMLCCSFALAFTGISGVFTDIGLQQLIVREVARDKFLAGIESLFKHRANRY